MDRILRIIWVTVWICFLIYVSSVIFWFFNIPFSSYGPYLMWVLALAILSSFLPNTINTAF